MKTKVVLFTSILSLASTGLSQPITFTKITSNPVVTDQGQFLRGTWGDFRNSGSLDLVVCGFANERNVFYRNDGNGTFTKITLGDPVQDVDFHCQANIGDYNNDGWLDLLIVTGIGAPSARRNILYHNNGDGTFTRASAGGLVNTLGFFHGSAWADYDNDGLLDAFVADASGSNKLWHNDGNGSFNRTNFSSAGDGAAVWADYDGDGWMDLLVIGNGTNFLYHNERDGTFRQILTNAIATDDWPGGTEAGAWGDYDNDGLPDLFVTGDDGSPNRLYHNDGDGNFTSVTMAPRPAGSDSMGCAWGDYDNDGYPDLFVCNRGAPNALYRNNGDGTFTQILTGDPVNDDGQYSICGWVDYDNDGFLDLFVSRATFSSVPTTNLLYHNNGNTNAWLEVKPIGKASNRSGIGAKVRVQATIRGKIMWQMREISNGGSRWDQPLVAHFGLGDATNVNAVRIEWPSGIVQTLSNIGPRQIMSVVEHQQTEPLPPSPRFTSVSHVLNGAANLSLSCSPGLLYVFEASTNLVDWTWLGARSNSVDSLQFTNSDATNYTRRFYRAFIP
jgi:hypothetical protein